MVTEYKSQITQTLGMACDGLVAILEPQCADDVLMRTDIEVRCVVLPLLFLLLLLLTHSKCSFDAIQATEVS